MKRVLITGANSYIGNSVENYITNNYPVECEFTTLDMIGDAWKDFDFSGYDVVFHVAGIAHDSSKKKDSSLYYRINKDLVVETADRAKKAGVNQFIFMSSMLVYNAVKGGVITDETEPKIKGYYADSKLQADIALQNLASDDFKVAIVRPPMIFGKDCKGNYQTLRKFALKLKIFPYVKNERSMLYIDNLSEFIRLLVLNVGTGVFFPQNSEYTNTSEMVKMIANAHDKKIYLIKGFAWIIKLLMLFSNYARKAFGNLIYQKETNNVYDYNKKTLLQAVREIECGKS